MCVIFVSHVFSIFRIGVLVGIAVALMSCAEPPPLAAPPVTRPITTLFPTIAATEPTPAISPPTATIADTGWLQGSHNVALRRLRISSHGEQAGTVVAVRIDPTTVQLQVGYTPEQPRLLHTWFADEQPLLAINGGFFTEEYQSTALVISNGAVSGSSYQGFGGMIAVARDGAVSLQALRDQPYSPDQVFDQALQSFPMLVFPGGIPSPIDEDHERARRSAVAFDHTGQLLFIVSPTSTFSLRSFADWLAICELAIDRALNLDGGSSTGMYLRAGLLSEQIDSFAAVPSVLLVRPK